MKVRRSSQHINIAGNRYDFPYSKGLLASSMMRAGISPDQAYRVAEKVEQILSERGETEVSSSDLRDLSASLLAEIHERYASSYLRWQAVEELDRPLIILLGGAAGVGKSTVATQLAARLGITRVISTDAIREVLRAAFSKEVMPVLYVSSFDADTVLRIQLPSASDQLIVGFQEQVCAVSVGIKALIARALEEGTDIIVEGAHVVPGYLEGWEERFPEAVLVPVVITVSDEEAHRSHFHRRMMESPSRPRDRYLSGFAKIRAIQSYISGLAREQDVPVVEMFELDAALQEIVAIVVAKALEKAQGRGEAGSTLPQTFDPDESEEMIKKSRPPRLRSREILGGRRNARAIP